MKIDETKRRVTFCYPQTKLWLRAAAVKGMTLRQWVASTCDAAAAKTALPPKVPDTSDHDIGSRCRRCE